ncbi:hypothetical protein Bbelb_177090 [Branchiostoma belcheri]|nr:hypothetical protein Bbelb_177090 [Branchiostoma belcheri]
MFLRFKPKCGNRAPAALADVGISASRSVTHTDFWGPISVRNNLREIVLHGVNSDGQGDRADSTAAKRDTHFLRVWRRTWQHRNGMQQTFCYMLVFVTFA